jgi:uncharacterized protein YjgD (DUF1641 family)
MGQRQRCITLASHVRQVNNIKEKLMNKTKVIAFRVNADEYEALSNMSAMTGEKLSEFVHRHMSPVTVVAMEHLTKARKKAEAKAKRLAKKEAASGL